MEWKVPRLWDGSDVFVIGGGPSVAGLDLTPIHDKRVIGVNNAFVLGHWVDICFFGDCRWWDNNIDRIRNHQCLKVTTCERLAKNGNLHVLKRQPVGFSANPNRLAWNGNSGFSAINLAFLLGAKRIFLIGFDMECVDGKHNWHKYHPNEARQDIYQTSFLPKFMRAKKETEQALADAGVQVFNLNPNSKLKLFPFLTFEEACESAL